SRVTHPFATRPPQTRRPKVISFDLHVLSTPPAFVLSQDQTLHQKTRHPQQKRGTADREPHTPQGTGTGTKPDNPQKGVTQSLKRDGAKNVATPNPTHGAQSKPPALAQTVLSSDFKEQPTPTSTHPQPGHPCLALASRTGPARRRSTLPGGRPIVNLRRPTR